MLRATLVQERVPLVWILVGLLFQSSGVYLGFDNGLTFVYMIVGMFCFAFGIALFALRLRERPRSPAKTRLSPHFISAGASDVSPLAKSDNLQPATQSGSD